MQQHLAEITAKLEISRKNSHENVLQGDSRKPLVQSIIENRQTEGETLPSHPKHSNKIATKNYGLLPSNADEGLDQTQLCNFYGMKSGNLTRDCRAAGCSNVAGYFAAMTGLRWEYRGSSGMKKLYFPIELIESD